jgi:type II secretory pathway pseudopilin PulG
MQLTQQKERGDTIIEVLFAVTVFALVAVGSMAIMNQGTAASQRALEITLVRQQIDAQAQALRYIHQSYVAAYQRGGAPVSGTAAEWAELKNHAAGSASPFGATAGTTCPTSVPGESPFIVNARRAEVWDGSLSMTAPSGGSLPPFAQLIYNNDGSNTIANAYGIWIEAVPSATEEPNTPGFIDFHIRACWESAGSTAPSTIGTIVRLYEPR